MSTHSHETHAEHAHVVSYGRFFLIYLGLIALTGLTVALAGIDLEVADGAFVSLVGSVNFFLITSNDFPAKILDAAERAHRIERYHRPYHDAVDEVLAVGDEAKREGKGGFEPRQAARRIVEFDFLVGLCMGGVVAGEDIEGAVLESRDEGRPVIG